VVGGANPAGVAKALKKFIEEKQKLEVKVGVLDKKLMTAAELSKLADLPSFDALRSMFLGLLTMQARPSSACSTPRSRRSSPLLPPLKPPVQPTTIFPAQAGKQNIQRRG
jgi:large subunit ribosomal protein L10